MNATHRRTRPGPKVAVNSVTPFLWFRDHAENAARFYVSLFRDSRVLDTGRSGESESRKKAKVQTVTFTLAGQPFVGLNGGPAYHFTPAFSVFVSCRTQREVDVLWRALTRGGHESRCGWLTDRYGLSWQIIPDRLPTMLSDPDPEKASRVLNAMLGMQKIVLADLEAAYLGP